MLTFNLYVCLVCEYACVSEYLCMCVCEYVNISIQRSRPCSKSEVGKGEN